MKIFRQMYRYYCKIQTIKKILQIILILKRIFKARKTLMKLMILKIYFKLYLINSQRR